MELDTEVAFAWVCCDPGADAADEFVRTLRAMDWPRIAAGEPSANVRITSWFLDVGDGPPLTATF
jgi:hypothetical protein